ncbi:hypothetical protein [Janthinobacterium sp. PC23-8]|uniref:hypothetical protein n=1 Tax=Janthinobacterium sp. PC23-8 TaxID=2012679 RepID=UPI001595ECF7|nr:hypothetical protein [Janthinobacterium sp. PC23-8]
MAASDDIAPDFFHFLRSPLVVVRDIEHMDGLVSKQAAELRAQARLVFFFPHEDDVAPAHILLADGMARIAAGAARTYGQRGMAAPYPLRRGAALLVAAADKQDVQGLQIP